MSGSPPRQAVTVGLLVALAVVLLAGGVLAVGDLRETFGRKLVVHTAFDDVLGLQEGANVWFAGVKIGTVRAVRFGDREVEVDLALEPAGAAHVPADAKAKVSTDALLGNKIVVLYEGTPGTTLAAGATLSAGEVVRTDDMVTMLQENNRNLVAITRELKSISADLAAGHGTAGRLLEDDALYDDARRTVVAIGDASEDAAGLARALQGLTAKLDREGAFVDALASDTATWDALAASARQLEIATARASALVEGLERATGPDGGSIGLLLHDEQAAEHLANTLAQLDRGSALLAEDLEAAQHNFLLRRWFKKRAREEARAPEATPEPPTPPAADGPDTFRAPEP